MINGCAEVDSNPKAILRRSGHIIYRSCDELAKEIFKQQEKAGVLNMDGKIEDAARILIVESSIDTIADTHRIKQSSKKWICFQPSRYVRGVKKKECQPSSTYLKGHSQNKFIKWNNCTKLRMDHLQ